MKKPAQIIGILIVAIVMLSIVKAFVTNRISTSGLTLGVIKDHITEKKRENILLSEKLYSLASLTYVSGKADSLGFVEEKSRLVISNTVPIAIKP